MTPLTTPTTPVFDATHVASDLQSNPSSPCFSSCGSPYEESRRLTGSICARSESLQLAQDSQIPASQLIQASQRTQHDVEDSAASPLHANAHASRHAASTKSLRFSPRPSFSLADVEVKSRYVEQDGETVEETYVVIDGYDGSEYRYADVRKMCTQLGVSGYKNRSKAVMLDLITQSKVNNGQYDAVFQEKKRARHDPPRKQAQDPFRLLNILFSDFFAGRLDALGDKRTRKDLDGCVSPEQAFWKDVQRAFLDTSSEANGRLAFTDKSAVLRASSVDPSVVIEHDWIGLQKIWHKLVTDYEEPLRRFTKSGTHSNQFYKFCQGRVDMLYLHEWLEVRPGLTAAVTRHLDKDVFYDSNQPTNTPATTAPKRQRSELAEAIRELVHERVQANSGRAKQEAMHEWFEVCDRLQDLCHKRNEEEDDDLVDQINTEIKILEGKRDELAKCI